MRVFIDCDDTLVMWEENFYLPSPDKIEIVDPYDNTTVFLTPHIRHIKLLKDYRERGYEVNVWSAGGYKWAESVVRALQLEDYVHYCGSKPLKYVDDLSADKILGERVYIPFMGKK